jgi:hypothetical protein
MKLSESSAKVIDLASAIRDYWDSELPKRHPNYPLVGPGEDSGPPPREEAELRSLLERLSDEEIYELILLTHLGRREFATRDLAAHYRELRETYRRRESAISQIADNASLAEYLADGVAELQKSGIDLDHLEFAAAAASG